MDTSTLRIAIVGLALATTPTAAASAFDPGTSHSDGLCYEVNPQSIPPVYVYFCHEGAGSNPAAARPRSL